MKPSTQKMSDIAKLADVSISTVSRALAGSPLVSKAKREQIIALATQHGYVVDTAARNLRLKRSNSICLAIPLAHDASQRLTDPFFVEMICHLADAITERGYGVYLQKVVPPMDNWLPRLLAQHRMDGLLVLGQSTEHAALQKVAERYLPMVVWGAEEADNFYCTVGTNNVLGGRMATEHLIRRQHRRIAYLGNVDAPEFRLRKLGWKAALEEAGLGESLSLTVRSDLTPEGSYEAMQTFLSKKIPFDAIFAASDQLAVSALRALRDVGMRVPEDVALVGFDDIHMAQLVHPTLTTIRQDLSVGARWMVERLFGRMAGVQTASAVLTPELVIRESAP